MDAEVVAVFVGFLIGIVLTIITALATGVVELKKRKPEAITHHCRVASLDVYTFITGKKTHTPPVCPYLDPEDYRSCQFEDAQHRVPQTQATPVVSPQTRAMQIVSQGECYIALFSQEFNLE